MKTFITARHGGRGAGAGESPHVTIIHDALDLTVQALLPPDMFKLVQIGLHCTNPHEGTQPGTLPPQSQTENAFLLIECEGK